MKRLSVGVARPRMLGFERHHDEFHRPLGEREPFGRKRVGVVRLQIVLLVLQMHPVPNPPEKVKVVVKRRSGFIEQVVLPATRDEGLQLVDLLAADVGDDIRRHTHYAFMREPFDPLVEVVEQGLDDRHVQDDHRLLEVAFPGGVRFFP